MKFTKRFLLSVSGVAVAGLMSSSALAGNVTLKVAGVLPLDHPAQTALEMVAKKVEDANVGVKMKLFPAGQLGSGEELIEDTIRGNIDMTFSILYANKHPALEASSLPFIVSSWDEVNSTFGDMNSTYSKIISETLDTLGLKYLGTGVEGLIGVVLTSKPDNVQSLGKKNKNIRVWNSQLAKMATEELGYRATTMNWSEAVPAVQAGTVDGAICCTATAAHTYFAKSDIGSVYIPYNAFVETMSVYLNKKSWNNKLNAEQRKVIEDAVDSTLKWYTDFSRDNDMKSIQKLKDKGWTVVDLSKSDRALISKTIKQNVWPKAKDIFGEEVFNRLVSGQ